MKAEIKKELDKFMDRMVKKHGQRSPVEHGVRCECVDKEIIKSTLIGIINMTGDKHIEEMAEFCIVKLDGQEQ